MDVTGEYGNDPAMRDVQLGVDVAHFIEHDRVGRYLIDRAHSDRVDALEDLVTVDPTNYNEIIRLQWKAKVPDMFLAWLQEAIAAGEAAEQTIALEEADSV